MSDFTFSDSAGREVEATILEVHDYDGNVYTGGDMADHYGDADRVFYSVDVLGETYYRWVAGPFTDEADVENAIEDEGDFYS